MEDLGTYDEDQNLGLASNPMVPFGDPLAFAKASNAPETSAPGLHVPGLRLENILMPGGTSSIGPAPEHRTSPSMNPLQPSPVVAQQGAPSGGDFRELNSLLALRTSQGQGLGGPTPTPTSNRIYSFPEMQALAQKAGFQGPDAAHIAAIAMAESGGNPGVTGRAGEIGLTQINPHAWGPQMAAAAKDPQGAFDQAFKVYGKQGWGAWSTDPSSKNFTPGNSMERFLPGGALQKGAPTLTPGLQAQDDQQKKLWQYMLLRTLFPQLKFQNIGYDPWTVHQYGQSGGY